MGIIFQIAIVLVPLLPIYLLSRLLILFCREFFQPLPSILIGNAIAFATILILGAIALSVDGYPHWSRSVSLFSVYAVVVVFDIGKLILRSMDSDIEILPPLPSGRREERYRQAPAARDRRKLRP